MIVNSCCQHHCLSGYSVLGTDSLPDHYSVPEDGDTEVGWLLPSTFFELLSLAWSNLLLYNKLTSIVKYWGLSVLMVCHRLSWRVICILNRGYSFQYMKWPSELLLLLILSFWILILQSSSVILTSHWLMGGGGDDDDDDDDDDDGTAMADG